MKRVLFALLGLLLAGTLFAATEVHEGQKFIFGPTGAPIMLYSPTDSLGYAMRAGGTTGSASFDDIDRDRDQEYSQSIWQSKLYANASSNSVDSSAVLDTQGWTYKSIAFSATVKDSTISTKPIVALFAISMRGHLTASHDTLTTFPIMPFKSVGDQVSQKSMSDTLGVAWVTTNEGDITGDALPYEIIVPIYPTSVAPRFKAINLNQHFGETGFRYTSYRIRLIDVLTTNGASQVGNATIAGTLVGQR